MLANSSNNIKKLSSQSVKKKNMPSSRDARDLHIQLPRFIVWVTLFYVGCESFWRTLCTYRRREVKWCK